MYVSTISSAHTPTIEQQVFRIISKRKAIRASRVRKTASLARDLRFDTVDVVDIILELERNFSITIPDEVPLYTVGDFRALRARPRRRRVRVGANPALTLDLLSQKSPATIVAGLFWWCQPKSLRR